MFIDYFSLFNLSSDGIQRLVTLLNSTDSPLLLSTLSVLCNISTNSEVRQAISNVKENLPEMFSNLLKTTNDEIRSKTSILIADICFIPSNQVHIQCDERRKWTLFIQEHFLHSDAVVGLSRMLSSPIEDVLVNACNAIDLLCRQNTLMQNELAKHGIIEQLTELLALDSSKKLFLLSDFHWFVFLFSFGTEILRGTVASALASITYNNMINQNLAASRGALKLIVDLMQDREFGIRYKAALAIEALSLNNVENQKQFLSKYLNVQKPLNELLEVKRYDRTVV